MLSPSLALAKAFWSPEAVSTSYVVAAAAGANCMTENKRIAVMMTIPFMISLTYAWKEHF